MEISILYNIPTVKLKQGILKFNIENAILETIIEKVFLRLLWVIF